MNQYRMMIVGIYLLIVSITDLRARKISKTVTFLCLLGIIISFIMERKMPGILSLSGIAVGLFLVGLSIITKGAIGIGDGIVFCMTGFSLGFVDNFSLLCMSLLGGGIVSIFLIVFKKAGRKDRIPFVPFICIAYGGMFLYG